MRAGLKSVLLFTVLIMLSCAAGSKNSHHDKQEKTGRIPPGQSVIKDFPVLHIGEIPDLNRENWTLTVTGEVDSSLLLNWDALMRMDTCTVISDFHCVTGWSRLHNRWQGVRISHILDAAGLTSDAKYVTFESADGYTTSLPVGECTGEKDLLGFAWEGRLLDKSLGGPVRVVIPGKYGYKSAMWLTGIKVTNTQETGYWEQRNYSNTANPWKEERVIQSNH